MAKLEEKAAFEAERTEAKVKLDDLTKEVQSLKEQLASGGTVTEENLNELLVGIKNIYKA